MITLGDFIILLCAAWGLQIICASYLAVRPGRVTSKFRLRRERSMLKLELRPLAGAEGTP